MRIKITALLSSMIFLPVLQGQGVIVPEFIQASQVSQDPYRYNGLLFVGDAIGSASFVGEGLITTAAHVIFDDEDFVWEPINRIRLYPRYHRTTPFAPTGKFFPPIAFTRWTSYATRVESDDSGPGLSSLDTFNLDYAVGYLNKFENDDLVVEYPEVAVHEEGEISVLRDPRMKTIIGYPSNSEFIPGGQRGLMHQTEPANYFSFWQGLTDFQSTWRDSEDFWVATYDFDGVATYSGNSGGPIYVRDDEDLWTFSGIVVGGNGSDGVLTRGIDDNAWLLIEEAMVTRGTVSIFRVDSVEITSTTADSVTLQWTDRSDGEAGYHVYRLDTGVWEQIAELPENATEYVDNSVSAGKVYHYRVQTIASGEFRRPKSPSVQTSTPGTNSTIASAIGQSFLNLRNSGDSNWHIDQDNRLRAGKVRSLGSSAMELRIIGPGTLRFNWSVSSEENEDYDNNQSPNFREIYDALYVYLNGNQVESGGAPVFLSGFVDNVSREVSIPEGSHTIKWTYEKDPYSDEGADTGFINTLEWVPGEANPYPVLGGFSFEGSSWNGSTWLGAHEASDFPWVGHIELGWLYLREGNGTDLYAYSAAPGMGDLYTRADLFPFIYHYQRETWVYYIGGTGSFGSGMWFYDLSLEDYFRVD